MLRFAAFIIVFCSFAFGGEWPASAAKRVALVIGNSAYEHATPLKNPKNDAEAITEALERLGFEVVTGIDLPHVNFAQTVNQFRKKLRSADVGLFFYAGHGLQVHGENYLAPIDAELDNETSLDFEAVPLRIILKLMERSTKTNLVFLDACRDNPLARNLARSMGTRSTAIGRGLARVESGVGTFIAYATQPGNVALDGQEEHSPFTKAFLNHVDTPGLDIEGLMRQVRREVIDATSGSQVPWSHSSLTGSIIFKEKPKEVAKPAPMRPVVDELAIDLAFWQAAKDKDTKQAYEAYLSEYPKGRFAPLAAIQLEEIAQSQEAAAERKAALEAAQKKQQEAEKAKREAEAKRKAIREAEAKKRATEEAARRKAEAEQRERELAALEKKQAAERERLAKERDDLAKRLKTLEEAAKARAEAKKQDEQKLAALQPPEQQASQTDTQTAPLLDARTMVLVLQNELKRVGCDPGKVDGKWGKIGTKALTNFNKYAKLKLNTSAPTMEALEAVKSRKDRVCPLECGPQFNKVGGRCVKKTCKSGQTLNSRGRCINVVAKKPAKKPSGAQVSKKKPTSRSRGDSYELKSCLERSAGVYDMECRGRYGR